MFGYAKIGFPSQTLLSVIIQISEALPLDYHGLETSNLYHLAGNAGISFLYIELSEYRRRPLEAAARVGRHLQCVVPHVLARVTWSLRSVPTYLKCIYVEIKSQTFIYRMRKTAAIFADESNFSPEIDGTGRYVTLITRGSVFSKMETMRIKEA